MPVCEKCGEAVGAEKFCPQCGTPTRTAREPLSEEQRFQSLGDAITASYATEAPRPRAPSPLRKGSPLWTVLGMVVLAFIIGGAALAIAWLPRAHRNAQPPIQLALQPTPSPPLAPRKTAPPTPAPTLAPTAAPTPVPTASPTATPVASAPPTIHNAPALVRSNGVVTVGKAGSCGGRDVVIDVRGYPRGCTIFDAASSGPLKDGHGTVLIVPVSTSEDVSDVAYGLLYLQSSAGTSPGFIGILPGDASDHLSLRVQDGLIVEHDGSQTKYATLNGHRIVWLNG